MTRPWSRAITVVVTGIATGCRSSSQTSNAYSPLFAPAGEPMCWADQGTGCQVSMISLVANPASFAGKSVQVVGFAILEFEGNAIYVSREAAEVRDTASAIFLDIEGLKISNPEKLNRQYVRVAGTFDAQNRGHIGMFSGTLKSISRLERAQQ